MELANLTHEDKGRLIRRICGGIVMIGQIVGWDKEFVYVRYADEKREVVVADYEIEFIDSLEDPFRISEWSTDESARRRYESLCRNAKRIAKK